MAEENGVTSSYPDLEAGERVFAPWLYMKEEKKMGSEHVQNHRD